MNQSLVKLQKHQKQRQDELKRQLLAEFALSIDALANDEELEPWAEIVGDQHYTLQKIESILNFGTLVLTFAPKDNPEQLVRLPLQLKF